MNRFSITCGLFAALLTLLPIAARPRFDERGNPIAFEALPKATADTGNNTATPKAAIPPKGDSAAPISTPTAEEDEEKSVRQALRNPLTQVYFENAQLYLRSGRLEKALENLRRAQELGEDHFAREARLQSYYLRARRGDANLAAEAEALDEAQRPPALLRIADGYYTCARETQKPDCLNEAERIYAFLSEFAPAATEGKLSALRLAQLLLEQDRQEAAFHHLNRLLSDEGKNAGRAGQIPYDRAWFLLGTLYERPWYYRDAHKASLAYRQVLQYPESPYHQQAKERLQWLNRFGLGK